MPGNLLLHWAKETKTQTPWELHLVTRDAAPETPGVFVHHGAANNSPALVRLYQSSDFSVLPTRADCHSLVENAARRQALGVAALAHAQCHFNCRVNLGRILAMMKLEAAKSAVGGTAAA